VKFERYDYATLRSRLIHGLIKDSSKKKGKAPLSEAPFL
jgi:hypothetical protein